MTRLLVDLPRSIDRRTFPSWLVCQGLSTEELFPAGWFAKVYRQKNSSQLVDLPRSIDRIIQWELTRFDGFFGGGGQENHNDRFRFVDLCFSIVLMLLFSLLLQAKYILPHFPYFLAVRTSVGYGYREQYESFVIFDSVLGLCTLQYSTSCRLSEITNDLY